MSWVNSGVRRIGIQAGSSRMTDRNAVASAEPTMTRATIATG